jgi:HAD domain in Swiss Army Knife RNA repair proteins
MKVIFLDLDGVLATTKEFHMNEKKFKSKNAWANDLDVRYPFNPGAVAIFNQILDETGWDVVLSSDWKYHWDLDQLDTIFLANGVKKSPIDVTHSRTIVENRSNLEEDRAYQILSWVKDNNPEDFVVFDDLKLGELLEAQGFNNHFFLCKSEEGLKQTSLKDKILKRMK